MATAQRAEVRATNLSTEDRRYVESHANQLSKTTLRAKWINDPNEKPDRPGQTLATRSPEVIRAWAEARSATPATATRRNGRPATLRFDFPGYQGRGLEHIDWDEWLDTFRDRDLVFLFQETTRDGRQSNFFRLDSPDREGD